MNEKERFNEYWRDLVGGSAEWATIERLAALEAWMARAALDDWRPIETAPKGGQKIMVCNPMTGPYFTACKNGLWPLADLWPDGSPGVWYPEPTQWKPRPAPPTEEK